MLHTAVFRWSSLLLLLFSLCAFADSLEETEAAIRKGSPLPQYSLDYLAYLVDGARPPGGPRRADWFGALLLRAQARFAEQERVPQAPRTDIERARAFAEQGFLNLYLDGFLKDAAPADFAHVLALSAQVKKPSAQAAIGKWLIANARTRANYFAILDTQIADAAEFPQQHPFGRLFSDVIEGASVRLRQERAALIVAYVEHLMTHETALDAKVEVFFALVAESMGGEGMPANYPRVMEHAMRTLVPRLQAGKHPETARDIAVSEATNILLNVIIVNRWYPASVEAMVDMFAILQNEKPSDPFVKTAAARWLSQSGTESLERIVRNMAKGPVENSRDLLACFSLMMRSSLSLPAE